MDGPQIYAASAPRGLLSLIVAAQPKMPTCACRGLHELWDAALPDPAAAEQARDICLHNCAALAACQEWAATLSRRQRAELGVLAGVIPVRKPRPKTSQETAQKPASDCPSAAQNHRRR
jgi:hypothetical protein